MSTAKDRPAETGPVEATEAFELAAMKDSGIGRVEVAQTGVTPVEVPRPEAGQTIDVTVVAGRPLKLAFAAADVKSREVVKDDLVLEFDNGGKIVLKEYMTAFGMLGEVRTTIIQPDGKHYAFTELLSPTAGPRAPERPAPGTEADVVIIQKPHAGETQHFKLTDQKPMALNFGFGEIAKSHVDKDGSLVLSFKDGAVLVLEGYSALKDTAGLGVYFAKGDKIALADLAPAAGPEEAAEGGRFFTEFAPGGTLGPLGHLGPLGPLPFTLIPPPGPPGSPPPESPPPPPPPPPPPDGEGPTYFIRGPECLIEEVDPAFTFGVTNLLLTGDQTRSIDIRVEFLAIQPGHGAASFDDFVGGSSFLFDAISAAAAAETGITVQDLGNGAVRVTFAANASTNQLTFNILPVDDGADELIEDFRFVLENEQVTGGAEPGTIVDGPGTSFVESQILDIDEFQVTISDGVGPEGDPLIFDVNLSNPSAQDIALDLQAQPLTTVNTNPATPGVDFEAGNFEYSTDGGITWIAAAGPNGTIVTIPAGSTAIQVRIETFADGTAEGDESFLLTVANTAHLAEACKVTNVVDGAGFIFDGVDTPRGPEWFIKGPECLIEEVDPAFTFGVSDLMLDPGQTRTVDIRVEFAALQPGHGAATFDDFVGGASFLFDAISNAAAAQTGITVQDLGNGVARVTFAADASTNQLTFDILAVDDGADEPIEDFRFVLENEQVTGGAVPGAIVPGEGTSFVDSRILDIDEFQVAISDGVGQEGDLLIFDVNLSNPSAQDIALDLEAQPLATIDTNPATPGVDFEAGNFEYSTDGGITWIAAAGPNGTIVTIPAGSTAIQVRIETFTDGTAEGDESFLLTVANTAHLAEACQVTSVVDGAGFIFDGGDRETPPPEWFICGPPCLIEEVDPTYTIGISELALEPGQERSIDVRVEFASFHTGHDAASFADLGGPAFLFQALSDAAAGETGITVQARSDGTVRVTFAADASTTQLEFDLLPVADAIDEKVEDFRIVLENSQATNGAQPGVIVPGEGTSFVTSHIVESDEYVVSIGDARAVEGDPLVFTVSLSNPHTDEPLTLDLEAISGRATAGVDFEAFGFEVSTDGGATWQTAGGPNGTSITFAAGETELLVRIATFPDSFDEGREGFRLTVANQDHLDGCDVSSVEDGKGIILDRAPHYEPPPRSDYDAPRGDWFTNRANWSQPRSTGAAHAAFASLIGLPIADQLNNESSDGKPAAGNDVPDLPSGNPQYAEGPTTEDYGWGPRYGQDDEGQDGSPKDSNHSGGWQWTNWGDHDDEQHAGRGDFQFGGKPSNNSSDPGYKNAADDAWSHEAARGESTGGPSNHGPQLASGDGVIVGGDGDDVLYGAAGDDRIRGGDGDDVIYAGLGDDIVRGGAGNDTIFGGGGADILRGGGGDDTLVAKAGFAEIHGGAGFDTFKFDDSGVLDLSLLGGRVTGIEEADITGTGNVELKLTFQDLLTMTDGGHQLTIVGDSGDKVSADLSGHSVAVTDMGAFTRYVIDGGAATLDIDNNVQKNIIGI